MAFSFASLNGWRKCWVVLVWFANILLATLLFSVAASAEQLTLFLLVVLGLFLLAGAWLTHVAVCRRRIGLQIAVLIMNLLGTNLVGVLVMMSIIRVSKLEIAAADSPAY